MTEKENAEHTVEELLAELFTEDVSNSLEDGDENTENEEKNIQYVISEEPLSNDVLSFLTSDSPEYLKQIEDEDFEKLFRLNKNTFFILQNEILNTEDDTGSYDTNLLLSLWILGNTAPFDEITGIFGLEEEHIKIICEKYYSKIIKLSSKYITWPSPSEMLSLEYIFKTEYDFPSIIGALGCLHIAVQLSENVNDCASYFNTNSGNYTIILQALCDSNLLFRDIFLGFPGGNSVEDILKASSLYTKLMDSDSFLRKTKRHILGGTQHPQMEALLTPYPSEDELQLTDEQLKFNALHSSAMLVLDKIFYLIENRFQRMKCLDSINIEFATLAVGAICVLHNFTRIHGDNFDL